MRKDIGTREREKKRTKERIQKKRKREKKRRRERNCHRLAPKETRRDSCKYLRGSIKK